MRITRAEVIERTHLGQHQRAEQEPGERARSCQRRSRSRGRRSEACCGSRGRGSTCPQILVDTRCLFLIGLSSPRAWLAGWLEPHLSSPLRLACRTALCTLGASRSASAGRTERPRLRACCWPGRRAPASPAAVPQRSASLPPATAGASHASRGGGAGTAIGRLVVRRKSGSLSRRVRVKSCLLLESLVARRAACLRAQPRQPPEAALPASHTRFYTAGSVRRRREMRGASMRSRNVRSFMRSEMRGRVRCRKVFSLSFHQSVNHVLVTWLRQPTKPSFAIARCGQSRFVGPGCPNPTSR